MPLLNQLNTLETSGLVRLAAVRPELEYLFRHALVQDAAYGSLLKNDRRQLHKSVGESLENLYPGHLDELAATLAHHFQKAEIFDKAIHYLMIAGNRASESFANTEAIGFYQAAIEQVEQAGQQMPDEQRQGLLAQVFEQLADVQERLGQHEAARETYYRAVAAQSFTLADKATQARLHRKIGTTYMLQRQYEEANRLWEQVETYLGSLSNPSRSAVWDEWIELQQERLMYYYWNADVPGMKRICDRLLPIVEQIGTPLQRANALYSYNLYLFRVQRYVVSDEVMAEVEKNILLVEQAGKLATIYDHHFTAGIFHFFRCELDGAETHLHLCLDLAERMGDPVRISRAANYLMFAARMRGQVEVTQSYFETVLSTTWAGPMADYTFTVQACKSWIAWREGRLDEARSYGMAARETVLGWFAHYPFQWIVYLPLIGIAVAQDQIAEAVEYAQIILDPKQIILPDDLTAALEAAVKLGESGQLDAARQPLADAIKLAISNGYL